MELKHYLRGALQQVDFESLSPKTQMKLWQVAHGLDQLLLEYVIFVIEGFES
jgi:hypothetical protein